MAHCAVTTPSPHLSTRRMLGPMHAMTHSNHVYDSKVVLRRARVSRRSNCKHCVQAAAAMQDEFQERDVVDAVISSGNQATDKKRIVVVGSGWATATFLKTLRKQQKDGDVSITVVSPRNYFLYTPLLPSTITGLVEERSIVEPMRNLVKEKGTFVEAAVLDVDPEKKELLCEKTFCSVCAAKKKNGEKTGEHDHTFVLKYDVLVMAVGSVTADFGVPGVREHCWFLKSVEDAHSLRVHLNKRYEQAAQLTSRMKEYPEEATEKNEELRKRLLNVTIVGGGPTGVEVAAELSDFVLQDMVKLFPEVPLEDVSISLMDPGDHVLRQYSPSIGEYAQKLFLEKQHVDIMLNKRIVGVEEEFLLATNLATGEEERLPYGTCVWATGVQPHPLVKGLKAKLEPQPGDSERKGFFVDEYFRVQGSQGSILALGDCAVMANPKEEGRPLPATAQVARQEAAYLAKLLNDGSMKVQKDSAEQPAQVVVKETTAPFQYKHLGQLAYLGHDEAAFDLPVGGDKGTLHGLAIGHLWRGMETMMQVSPRNMSMVFFDWVRVKLFGRNMSDV